MAYGNEDEDDGVGPITAAGKATEDKLGDLHGTVAEYLTLMIASGKAPPTLIGAAITFLKNNSITASPSQNAALSNLSRTLAERRKRRGGPAGLNKAEAAEAEEAFSNMMGGMPGLQ